VRKIGAVRDHQQPLTPLWPAAAGICASEARLPACLWRYPRQRSANNILGSRCWTRFVSMQNLVKLGATRAG
jgi:hypothetical protein